MFGIGTQELILFGIMGWLGLRVNMGAAMIAAVFAVMLYSVATFHTASSGRAGGRALRVLRGAVRFARSRDGRP